MSGKLFVSKWESADGIIDVDELSGRFEFGGKLDEDGSVMTYRARQCALERDVAIKILSPSAASSPAAVRHFFLAARTVARLRSSHTAAVFDCGSTHSGVHYVVAELLSGRTLSDELADAMCIAPARALASATFLKKKV